MYRDFITDSELPLHLGKVEQRWHELRTNELPQKRAEQVQKMLDHASMERLLATARNAKTRAQRVIWLQRAADVLGRAVTAAGAAPCQKGCDSCCHVPVLISRAEAEGLAAVSKRKLRSSPVGAIRLDEQLAQSMSGEGRSAEIENSWRHHVGTPCPFLAEGACSVWEARPLACRYYYSLDKDNLLCKLIEDGHSVEVPKLNTVANTAVSMLIEGLNQEAADIRDWFA
jgi:Fe-S-cluster containining protein